MSRYNHADNVLDRYFQVLDHGFIAVKDYFGSDEAIEAAARVSYQSGTRKTSDTRNLIRYLVRNNHSSPIEQASITFHMRLPLYVIQQLLRHRTAKLNQESFRYSEVPELNHIVGTNWRIQSTSNKQGSDGNIYGDSVQDLKNEEILLLEHCKNVYNARIDAGVAREQARKDIPVSTYSSMYWTMDVRNLLHFMDLRCDSHAQEEIRAYANIIAGFVKEIFPITFEAWYDYSYGSVTFSRLERKLIYKLKDYGVDSLSEYKSIDWGIPLHAELGMSDREFNEFWLKQNLPEENDFTLDFTKCKEII